MARPLVAEVGVISQAVESLAAVVLRQLHLIFQGSGRHAHLKNGANIPGGGGPVQKRTVCCLQCRGHIGHIVTREAGHGADGTGFSFQQHHSTPTQHCAFPLHNRLQVLIQR